jgi:hypothetical protein
MNPNIVTITPLRAFNGTARRDLAVAEAGHRGF